MKAALSLLLLATTLGSGCAKKPADLPPAPASVPVAAPMTSTVSSGKHRMIGAFKLGGRPVAPPSPAPRR